jgi:hypothetical protein
VGGWGGGAEYCYYTIEVVALIPVLCGSGTFIPDPDFLPSRISDLRFRIPVQQQHKFHKIESYFVFEKKVLKTICSN